MSWRVIVMKAAKFDAAGNTSGSFAVVLEPGNSVLQYWDSEDDARKHAAVVSDAIVWRPEHPCKLCLCVERMHRAVDGDRRECQSPGCVCGKYQRST